jgi:hypothetical protein
LTAALVYIETNWIVASVMGQDPSADGLLTSDSVRLLVPSVCVMEALKSFERKRRERNELASLIERQLNQVRRSVAIEEATRLARELQEAKVENDDLLHALYKRLDATLARVVERAEMIHPSGDDVIRACDLALLAEHERADTLILAIVMRHSKNQLEPRKALLTGDLSFADFASQLVETELKVFHRAEAVLGWASTPA